MDAKRRETYRTLHEIRLRKEVVLSEIRRDNERMNILWKDLFRKPKPQKKGFTLSTIMTTGAGLADGFMLAWKLYRKFKK
jgi:hypothetical protein